MLTIRNARADDVLPLLQFAEVYHEQSKQWDFYGELDGIWLMNNIAIAVNDPNQIILVAVKDSELVGVYWGCVSWQTMAPIPLGRNLFFFVHPDHRTFSIARQLVSEFEKWCKYKGAVAIAVGCNFSDVEEENRGAVVLHTRMCYRPFGQDYFKKLRED